MSVLQATAIRIAITELLQGTIGTTRLVPMGMFQSGVHPGQPVYKQQIRALDVRYTHRFDVTVRSAGPHEATPISVKSAYRVSRMRVEINITTKLKSQVRDDARELVRATVEGDCSTAIESLNYPNNLLETQDDEPTGIVSGMILGPDSTGTPTWEMVEENWEQLLLRSRITGEAIVTQTQAVA